MHSTALNSHDYTADWKREKIIIHHHFTVVAVCINISSSSSLIAGNCRKEIPLQTPPPQLTLSRVRVPDHNLILGVVLAGDLGRFGELARVPNDVVGAQGSQRLSTACAYFGSGGHRSRWGGGAQRFIASLMMMLHRFWLRSG